MEVKNMANAILAAILSFLIPGLGQAYCNCYSSMDYCIYNIQTLDCLDY